MESASSNRNGSASKAQRRWPNQRHSRYCVIISLIAILVCICGCNLGTQRHNVAGKQALELGQYSAAINRFQQALNSNPQDANAYYNLGAAYNRLAKQSNNQQWITQAEQLYRQAISLNDQHSEAHRSLAALLIETNREKFAFDLMKEWKNRFPNATEPVVELARLYQEYGDDRRATDLLADALKLDPNNVRALKALGHIREVQGQTHLALDNYLRVLQLDQTQTAVAAQVASLQSRLAALPVPNGLPANQTLNPHRYGSIDPYLRR